MSDKGFIKMILQSRFDDEFVPKKSRSKSITGEKFDIKPKTNSRYIKAHLRQAAIDKTNGKCSYPNCNNPYQVLHHTNRFSESKNHDSITPLCKIHHEFAHNNLIANETKPSNEWRMSPNKPPTDKLSKADALYRQYRQKALL